MRVRDTKDGYPAVKNTVAQPPTTRLPVDETGLCAWFGQATTGGWLIYHRGFLARDRSPAASQLHRRDQAELSRVARRALALAQAGLASLAQRRLGPDDYEYQISAGTRVPISGGALVRVLADELG
jgi:hypothetical protein